jgi:methylmalonyl-CoA mutase N-terminal domain/subunit
MDRDRGELMTDKDNQQSSALKDAYFERPTWTKTWSRQPLNTSYGPDDRIGADEPPLPGEYPFTRGIHPDMYRGRFWTRRNVSGQGLGSDSNERVKFLLSQGQAGLNVIFDIAGMVALDGDHPLVNEGVGIQGCAMSSLPDMMDLTADIDLEQASFSFPVSGYHACGAVALYVAAAEARGFDRKKLRGTTQSDALHVRFVGYEPADSFAPIDMSLRCVTDLIEFASKELPLWNPVNINMYDYRENGIDAAQEVAFGFATAIAYVESCLQRGIAVDDFAPRLAFYCSAHMDLFEEVAKLRAARRMWARIMRERFGAKDPASWKFRFGVHTAGCSLIPQQPLNNVVRVAYEALAAVLGGCQTLHCCSYDEPIALPTEESHTLALRTQQILAYETGVANVADPLGGSWYVESLTDNVEARAQAVLDEIESRGGWVECLRERWVDEQIDAAALKYANEVNTGERPIVGLNLLRVPPESEAAVPSYEAPTDAGVRQAKRLAELRADRDPVAWQEAMEHVRVAASNGSATMVPTLIEAYKAGGTSGEIFGVIRMVYGHHYDPFEVLEPPAELLRR